MPCPAPHLLVGQTFRDFGLALVMNRGWSVRCAWRLVSSLSRADAPTRSPCVRSSVQRGGADPMAAATRLPERTALSMYPAKVSVCSPANQIAPCALRSSGQNRVICPGA